MEAVARVLFWLKKKGTPKRRSIESARRGRRVELVADARFTAVDESILSEDGVQCMSVGIRQFSTPTRRPGVAEMGDRRASQADSCLSWDEAQATDVNVDSPTTFLIEGGDDTRSIVVEDGLDEEALRKEQKEEVKEEEIVATITSEENEVAVEMEIDLSEFDLSEHWEDDGFDQMFAQQNNLGLSKPAEDKAAAASATFTTDDQGYEWEDLKLLQQATGCKQQLLPRLGGHNLGYPKMIGWSEEALGCVARSLLNDDVNRNGRKRRDTPITEPTMTSSKSPPIRRPDSYEERNADYLKDLYDRAGLTAEMPTWLETGKVQQQRQPAPAATCAYWRGIESEVDQIIAMLRPDVDYSGILETRPRPMRKASMPSFNTVSTPATAANKEFSLPPVYWSQGPASWSRRSTMADDSILSSSSVLYSLPHHDMSVRARAALLTPPPATFAFDVSLE